MRFLLLVALAWARDAPEDADAKALEASLDDGITPGMQDSITQLPLSEHTKDLDARSYNASSIVAQAQAGSDDMKSKGAVMDQLAAKLAEDLVRMNKRRMLQIVELKAARREKNEFLRNNENNQAFARSKISNGYKMMVNMGIGIWNKYRQTRFLQRRSWRRRWNFNRWRGNVLKERKAFKEQEDAYRWGLNNAMPKCDAEATLLVQCVDGVTQFANLESMNSTDQLKFKKLVILTRMSRGEAPEDFTGMSTRENLEEMESEAEGDEDASQIEEQEQEDLDEMDSVSLLQLVRSDVANLTQVPMETTDTPADDPPQNVKEVAQKFGYALPKKGTITDKALQAGWWSNFVKNIKKVVRRIVKRFKCWWWRGKKICGKKGRAQAIRNARDQARALKERKRRAMEARKKAELMKKRALARQNVLDTIKKISSRIEEIGESSRIRDRDWLIEPLTDAGKAVQKEFTALVKKHTPAVISKAWIEKQFMLAIWKQTPKAIRNLFDSTGAARDDIDKCQTSTSSCNKYRVEFTDKMNNFRRRKEYLTEMLDYFGTRFQNEMFRVAAHIKTLGMEMARLRRTRTASRNMWSSNRDILKKLRKTHGDKSMEWKRTEQAKSKDIRDSMKAQCGLTATINSVREKLKMPALKHCIMTPWEHGLCSKTCGGGTQTARRKITQQPANGGIPCGALEKVVGCNEQICPIHCKVGQWGKWGKCKGPGQGGWASRFREILRGSANGGSPCPSIRQRKKCPGLPKRRWVTRYQTQRRVTRRVKATRTLAAMFYSTRFDKGDPNRANMPIWRNKPKNATDWDKMDLAKLAAVGEGHQATPPCYRRRCPRPTSIITGFRLSAKTSPWYGSYIINGVHRVRAMRYSFPIGGNYPIETRYFPINMARATNRNNTWAQCPQGYYLHAIKIRPGDGWDDMTGLYCIRFTNLPDTACTEDDVSPQSLFQWSPWRMEETIRNVGLGKKYYGLRGFQVDDVKGKCRSFVGDGNTYRIEDSMPWDCLSKVKWCILPQLNRKAASPPVRTPPARLKGRRKRMQKKMR